MAKKHLADRHYVEVVEQTFDEMTSLNQMLFDQKMWHLKKPLNK